MKKIQIFLKLFLGFIYLFVKRLKVKNNKITFITIESNELHDDLKLIYDKLDKEKYDVRVDAFQYDKKTLKNNVKYLFQCIKQVYDVNTSKVVLLRDNNFVVSNFKRKEVNVIQVWHASGAVKKFGNTIERKYRISNYDYVIANSDYWKEPYAKAFAVDESQVLNIGTPKIDLLFDKVLIAEKRKCLLEKMPELKGKKVILYAPTFRGDIYRGFKMISFDLEKILNSVGEDFVVVCKYHPLLAQYFPYKHERILNGNKYNTYDLFMISDFMISDYSSIIFDYALLNKPMIYYVPDLDEYSAERGLFIEYESLPGRICKMEEEVIDAINEPYAYDISSFAKRFFTYQDGKNTERNVEFIQNLIETSCK